MTLSTAKLASWQFKTLESPGGVRFELVDGEIVVSRTPNLHHAEVVAELFLLIKLHVVEYNLGKIFMDTGTEFGLNDVRRPDLLFFRKSRIKRLDPMDSKDLPDLAVEVISPGTEQTDRKAKFKQYAKGGIQYYWIIDPRKRTFEGYVLSGGKYKLDSEGAVQDVVRTKPFPKLEIPLEKLWWK
jgi:Uma2 family endonuclease